MPRKHNKPRKPVSKGRRKRFIDYIPMRTRRHRLRCVDPIEFVRMLNAGNK